MVGVFRPGCCRGRTPTGRSRHAWISPTRKDAVSGIRGRGTSTPPCAACRTKRYKVESASPDQAALSPYTRSARQENCRRETTRRWSCHAASTTVPVVGCYLWSTSAGQWNCSGWRGSCARAGATRRSPRCRCWWRPPGAHRALRPQAGRYHPGLGAADLGALGLDWKVPAGSFAPATSRPRSRSGPASTVPTGRQRQWWAVYGGQPVYRARRGDGRRRHRRTGASIITG